MERLSAINLRRRWPSLLGIAIVALCICRPNQILAADGNPLPHPLDPLSSKEVTLTVEVLRNNGKIGQSSRFPAIALHEPEKAEVLRFKSGTRLRREAFAIIYERAINKTFEAVVDLDNKSVVSWKEIPGAQPPIMLEDIYIAQRVVRNNPDWQEALRKRGVTDFEKVQIDVWPAGYYGLADEDGIRAVRAIAYYKGTAKNAYARPIEGVIACVNLNSRKVFKLIDTGIVPIPKYDGNYGAEAAVGKSEKAPDPLQITQPRGASYTVSGNEVRWQNWQFRFALHPIDGLVIYTVGYKDQDKVRSVLYRASLSEMVVPYADPGPAWFFRNVFDKGEFGLGWLANSLEPNTDAPNNAQFFDAVLSTNTGTPYELPRAVAIYEREGGLLWKHYNYETNESRRARDLVLSYIVTVGNYDYGFNWIFHQDGTLEMEVLLTGIMSTKAVNITRATAHQHTGEMYGHLVADNLEAVHHQHFFNFRLDMDIDQPVNNSVIEMNTEAIPARRDNPYFNAFVMRETLLRKEKQAQRQLNLASSRKWKIINSSIRNALGQPVAYVIVPGENSIPYAHPNSSVRRRAAFMNAHFWVTQYQPTEMSAAGLYINQSRGGEGLPKWTSANRSIEDQDIVVWYTLGITHLPRPEEWPVMTTHRAGFKLMPSGFFSRNPVSGMPKTE